MRKQQIKIPGKHKTFDHCSAKSTTMAKLIPKLSEKIVNENIFTQKYDTELAK